MPEVLKAEELIGSRLRGFGSKLIARAIDFVGFISERTEVSDHAKPWFVSIGEVEA